MQKEDQTRQGLGAKARSNELSGQSTLPLKPRRKTPAVLDMGEASREEGFRLNGCR